MEPNFCSSRSFERKTTSMSLAYKSRAKSRTWTSRTRRGLVVANVGRTPNVHHAAEVLGADDHAHGVHAVWRQHLVVWIEIGCRETQLASALVARFDRAEDREGASQHRRGAIQTALQHVLTNGRRADHLVVEFDRRISLATNPYFGASASIRRTSPARSCPNRKRVPTQISWRWLV
jgi:hypothetical protein